MPHCDNAEALWSALAQPPVGAADAVNSFVRAKMREDGLYRRILRSYCLRTVDELARYGWDAAWAEPTVVDGQTLYSVPWDHDHPFKYVADGVLYRLREFYAVIDRTATREQWARIYRKERQARKTPPPPVRARDEVADEVSYAIMGSLVMDILTLSERPQ